MGRLVRGSGNRSIAAFELQRWAQEAMQVGALAGGGKGKVKARLQGPEYQGLADNTADGNKVKKKKEVSSWGAGNEASSRPRVPQMPVPGGSRKKTVMQLTKQSGPPLVWWEG
jgi:hypothetical protein